MTTDAQSIDFSSRPIAEDSEDHANRNADARWLLVIPLGWLVSAILCVIIATR